MMGKLIMGLFDLFNNDKQDYKEFGLFSFLEEDSKKKKNHNLEDWQQKLVDESKYDSTSFEEDLEKDYYYEDDE